MLTIQDLFIALWKTLWLRCNKNKISTISANIDASQPWRRSHCDNVIYTDWKRDNFLRAIVSIIGRDEPPKNIGLENDHVTLDVKEKIESIFTFSVLVMFQKI